MAQWLHNRLLNGANAHENLYFPRYGLFQWVRSLAVLAEDIEAESVKSRQNCMHERLVIREDKQIWFWRTYKPGALKFIHVLVLIDERGQ